MLRALRASPRPPAPTARRLSAAAVEGQKQRTIFNAHNTQTLPGDVVRREGGPPSGDVTVDESYDGLGATYDFFWAKYDRNSIDDEGTPLNVTVHFDREYNNAF
jgi:Zn-dependent metalloprotease